ncbi:MAG: SDR family oxidoreductase [Bdellovibrionales bacterium]|nr:SDR family oxidoreductase [Bdellovibrionales bacterium]
MKEVFITGAGSGIGAATAEIFYRKGWKVYLAGRNRDKLEAVRKRLGPHAVVVVFDQSQSAHIPALKLKLEELKVNISALVNNAGFFSPALFAEENDGNWATHFETNLMGPVRLTRLLWPQLQSNKGCVTNVSSTLGLRPIPNTGAYSALKAALNNWTQTLALEGAVDGVRVNAICPGLVDTPIHSYHQSSKPEHVALFQQLQKLQPLGRIGQPDDIAQAIYFTCSEEASWMTGALVPVDGGVILTTRDP